MSVIEMPATADLTGRIVMLNMETCTRFQCPGFSLSPNTPFQMVPPAMGMNPGTYQLMTSSIRQALLQGRLVDVTEQGVKGLKIGASAHTAVAEEDAGKPKVIMGTDRKGNLYIVTPRDKDHETELLKELRETGTISNMSFSESEGKSEDSGLSSVFIEDVVVPKIILTDPD